MQDEKKTAPMRITPNLKNDIRGWQAPRRAIHERPPTVGRVESGSPDISSSKGPKPALADQLTASLRAKANYLPETVVSFPSAIEITLVGRIMQLPQFYCFEFQPLHVARIHDARESSAICASRRLWQADHWNDHNP
jgi:hypothetical protein